MMSPSPSGRYDLVIVGGTAPGLSVAISSLRSGLGLVRIVEESSTVAFPELAAENSLDIGYGEAVSSIELVDDDLVVNTDRLSYRTQAVLVAQRAEKPDWTPPLPVAKSDRILARFASRMVGRSGRAHHWLHRPGRRAGRSRSRWRSRCGHGRSGPGSRQAFSSW